MTQKSINIGTSPNKGDGDPLRTAFGKINDNFDELYATDTATKYHLGDDVQFVDIDADSGMVVIQSGFDTGMPVYIKGANCADEGVGGNVIIEAGGAPLPNNGTTGNIELAAQQTTIESNNNMWTFRDDGVLELPEGGDIVDSNGDTVLGGTGGSGDSLVNGDSSFSISTDGTLTLTHPDEPNFHPLETQLIIQKAAGNYHTISGAYGLSLQATPVPSGYGLNTNTNFVDIFHDGVSVNVNDNTWGFGTDGTLTLPTGGAITSPDCNFSFNKDTGNFALPTLGTVISSEGLEVGNTGNSEVYMGSGFGEFRSIYNNNSGTESGLTYAGVEGFNYVQQGDVNFSGIVSQTPNIDSMYSVGLNEDGQIVIGFTQNGQTQASTDWSVTVGTLNTDMTVNGLFANTTTTVIGSGLSSWTFGTDGSLQLPAGGTIAEGGGISGAIRITPAGGANVYQALLIYPTAEGEGDHIHLTAGGGTTDLYLGNDDQFVKIDHGGNVVVATVNANHWTFDTTGDLTLPTVITGTGSTVKSQSAIRIQAGQYYLYDVVSQSDGWGLGSGNVANFHTSTSPDMGALVSPGDIAHSGSITATVASVVSSPSNGGQWEISIGDPMDGAYSGGTGAWSFSKAGDTGGTWQFGTDGILTLPTGGTVSYTPTTATDWNGTAPTTIQEAIDRLAAAFKILNSGTGA